MKRDPVIPVFVAMNFVLAGCAAGLCVLFGVVLYEEIVYAGLAPSDRHDTIVGGIIIGMPCVAAALIFAGAGINLMRRARSGYYLHVMGAGVAALSGVGILYTVPAVRFAARESFRNEFFAPADPPGFTPVFVRAVAPSGAGPVLEGAPARGNEGGG